MWRIALAGPLALVLCACSSPQRAPQTPDAPTTAATTAVTSIPEGFPLSAGMASQEYDDVSVSAQSVGMRALDFCGRKPLRGLTLTDRLAAEASGNEYAHTRDLMLFPDTAAPSAVAADIRAAATACAAESTGPGSRLLSEVRESSLGVPGSTILHTYEQDGSVALGAEVIEVVQVGRALLVTSTYAEWDPGTSLDDGIAEEADRLEETVEAMSVFDRP